jgi:hypothetical protein
MKRQFEMKKTATYLVCAMFVAGIAGACNDGLDIRQDYGYSVETLPLPASLERGEAVDLEFSILREGYYSETQYRFRYFVSEGEGTLTRGGKALPMNRFHDIAADDFVLTWQPSSDDAQRLDFVFEDSFGRRVEYTVEFSGERTEDEPQTGGDDNASD